jgi:hypothetical protein
MSSDPQNTIYVTTRGWVQSHQWANDHMHILSKETSFSDRSFLEWHQPTNFQDLDRKHVEAAHPGSARWIAASMSGMR